MEICQACGATYEPSKMGPKVKYVGLCPNCRQKKHMETHISRNKEAYLQKHRFYHKKYAYGLDAAAFAILYKQQDSKVAICETPFPPLTQRTKQVAVDHAHVTGRVRALLCPQCNAAVAMVRENVLFAESLVRYLQKHQLNTN